MGYLTRQQLNEVWVDNGLKDRIARFRQYLKELGLLEFITAEKLQDHFYDVLDAYFVRGIKENADGSSASQGSVGDTEVEGQER